MCQLTAIPYPFSDWPQSYVIIVNSAEGWYLHVQWNYMRGKQINVLCVLLFVQSFATKEKIQCSPFTLYANVKIKTAFSLNKQLLSQQAMENHVYFLIPWSLNVSLYWNIYNIFPIVLHKRSFFPSQLLWSKRTHFEFTVFHNTNCFYCPERTLVWEFWFEVKGTWKWQQSLMGMKSILQTPLFSADVFQWAWFHNVNCINRQMVLVVPKQRREKQKGGKLTCN